MNNIQIINGVKIDWNKFKSKAKVKGGNLDRARQSYIDLCIMMHNNGHKLLSDYTSALDKITVDISCGHDPIEILQNVYKTKNGNIDCPQCMEEKYNNITTLPTEQPKYNKDIYRIGFYNDKVDDIVKLCDCNRVFNDITSLKYHIRDNDIVELASKFSLYGIDKEEILRLKETYNVEFRIGGKDMGEKLNSILKVNEFVFNNKETISKLI